MIILPTVLLKSCSPEAWGSFLSLEPLWFDEFFVVIIDPAVYEETEALLLPRAPIWLFD